MRYTAGSELDARATVISDTDIRERRRLAVDADRVTLVDMYSMAPAVESALRYTGTISKSE
jgi:hypothetical protein